MSDSDESGVTYTKISSTFEELSDIGSPGVVPSPDYIPGPKEPQSPPRLDYVPEPIYLEYMPQEDEVFPAKEQPLPASASPTAQSPNYVSESDLEADPEEDDDEDPEEDPDDYPADGGDDGDDEEGSSEDDDMDIEAERSINQADKCVYNKFDEFGKGVIICLNVDDMLIFGTDQVQVDLTKEFLSSRFSMKDMGEANVILGIRIKHESNGIAISQSHYIEKVLKKFNYFDCTRVSTPMDTSEKLMPNNGKAVSQLEYSRVIGCLMYVMTCTSPDIAFVVGKLSMYTSNHGYTDASWINNNKDNSSTIGWVFLLGGGAISWASKKQTCITNLTMESEFVALAAAGKEVEWLRNLFLEISLWSKPIAHISIRCDNVATLAKAYS
ncbi:zinc finger, CCHC-type containing protein [Tanacetum coccineum]